MIFDFFRKRKQEKKFEKVKGKLEKMKYAVVGTGAVSLCLWNKKAIKGERGCWKELFYGVSSAGCCQMTPSVMWCENQCLHCWRPIEMNLGTNLPSMKMSPVEFLDKIVEERAKILDGFKGSWRVNKKILEEAKTPKLFTMSLSGEPTIYPHLGELFAEIRRRKAVSFLVTNGLNPDAIKKLKKENALPTQLTVSTNAPNEKMFAIWHRSCKKNAWQEFNKTLDLMKTLDGKCRRVIRMTLVKKGKGETPKFNDLTNMSDENVEEYAKLILKASPDFVHIKGFKSLGYSRERFGYDKQPIFEEVEDFAKKLAKVLKKNNYSIKAKDARSNVVMIAKKGKKLKIDMRRV